MCYKGGGEIYMKMKNQYQIAHAIHAESLIEQILDDDYGIDIEKLSIKEIKDLIAMLRAIVKGK